MRSRSGSILTMTIIEEEGERGSFIVAVLFKIQISKHLEITICRGATMLRHHFVNSIVDLEYTCSCEPSKDLFLSRIQ